MYIGERCTTDRMSSGFLCSTRRPGEKGSHDAIATDKIIQLLQCKIYHSKRNGCYGWLGSQNIPAVTSHFPMTCPSPMTCPFPMICPSPMPPSSPTTLPTPVSFVALPIHSTCQKLSFLNSTRHMERQTVANIHTLSVCLVTTQQKYNKIDVRNTFQQTALAFSGHTFCKIYVWEVHM